METQIVIFLAFVSVTLIFNSVIIWFAYKSFANVTISVASTISEFHTSDSGKAWLKTLESASSQAASVTETAKTQLANFDPVLAQAQSKFEFRLAQIDVQMEKSVATVLQQTQKVQEALVSPAERIGATLTGVQQAINLFNGWQSDGDANSTPKK